ncbi:MAG: hypothetical protein IJW45_03700 [Oscillospiraceae bacterium]|nr:hypothetical protein [Oscillospiraceae bacterium]
MRGYMSIYDKAGEKVAVVVMVDYSGVEVEACARAIHGAFGAKAGRMVCDVYNETYNFIRSVEICGETCG